MRGGGHNVSGRALCDDGIVIDLSAMKGIHVNAKNRTARVQGGAAALLHTPEGIPAVAVAACYCGDMTEGEKVFKPLRTFSSPNGGRDSTHAFPADANLTRRDLPRR